MFSYFINLREVKLLMNILIMGATGFIGYNLTKKLYENLSNKLTCFSRSAKSLQERFPLANCINGDYCRGMDFDKLLYKQETVFHLISTTYPATSNRDIARELSDNVFVTIDFLNACRKNKVKKIVFISSGGTVYGDKVNCPIKENDCTNPINSYGIQKLTIEKLLYMYYYLYKMDYRIIRLSNPFGPYQRVNNGLGVITNFINRAINEQPIDVFGDGSIIRDFIYIDDAITGIMNIANYSGDEKLFNLGSGKGMSIKKLIAEIEACIGKKMDVNYLPGRIVDVPDNILDIHLYEREIGQLELTPLSRGLRNTLDYQLSLGRKLK